MDTYKENVHRFKMWKLNTHKRAFESCSLMTVFEDPGFVLMLPLVFSFRALAISSFLLLLLLLSPLLLSLLLPSSLSSLLPSPSYPPLPSLPLSPPFPSSPYLTSPLSSPPLSPSPLLFLSSLFSGGDTKRQVLLLLPLQIGAQVGTSGEDII